MAGASDHRPGNVLRRYLIVRHYLTLPDDDSFKELKVSLQVICSQIILIPKKNSMRPAARAAKTSLR